MSETEKESSVSDIVERLRAHDSALDFAVMDDAADEIESLRQQVVTSFDLYEVPQFRQGIPKHELEEVVTAERCAWFVGELIALRQRVAELENTEHEAEGICHEHDGCPTENAVLKREWRELRQRVTELEKENVRIKAAWDCAYERAMENGQNPAPIPEGYRLVRNDVFDLLTAAPKQEGG